MPNGTVIEPVFPQVLLPHTPEGCKTAADYRKVILAAYSNQADMESNLFIRFYNLAIQNWITDLIVIDGRPIICVKSTPMRAFSTYRHLLVHTGFEHLPKDSDDIERFPLPFANFTRGIPKTNPRLKQDSYPIRNIGFLDGTMKRRVAHTRYPRAMLIPYSIDLWCKYESHMDYMIQRVQEQFVPMAYYDVSSPFSDGTIVMPIKLTEITDNSDLERDQTDDRLLRITVSIEVEAWMFFDIHQAPTFQTETKTVSTVLDKDLSGEEEIFTVSDKLTPLAPPTLEERAASTSEDVPSLQP